MAKEKSKETDENKIKRLSKLIVNATKYKDNTVYKSTGIISLDIALKCGGYVSGRICEYFGPNHSGKTLTTMLAIMWDQKMTGRKSLFVDTEGSFDIKWFIKLGGIPELLDIYDPYSNKKIYGEEIFNNTIDLISTGNYSFVAVDSFMGPALLSKKILDKSMDEEAVMGVQAKMNKSFLMRGFIETKQTDTNLLITNHIAKEFGVMFGDPETTPGGDYMKFAAEQRLRISASKGTKTEAGHTVKGIIKKNKRGASAGTEFDFYLSYQYGIDNYVELAKLLANYEIINKKEKADLVVAVREDIKLFNEYKVKLLEVVNGGTELQENEVDEIDDFEAEKILNEDGN